MMHYVHVEDDNGEVVTLTPYCSDSCAREDEFYAGWSGCHETEFREYCFGCGVAIPGFADFGDPVGGEEPTPCDCVADSVVVNLIGPPEDEWCEHGDLVRAGTLIR